MAYADKIVREDVAVGASVSDNTDLSRIPIPGGKEVQLKELFALIETGSPTSGAEIEVTDASNNVLLSVSIEGSAGDVNRAGQSTKPVIYTAGSSDTFLKFRTNLATGASTDVTCTLDYTYPGSYAKS